LKSLTPSDHAPTIENKGPNRLRRRERPDSSVFKWIKQNLRIKHFFGNSENAVKAQVWISISVYVLVAIIKKELKLESSLSSILQILSVNAFSKEPLAQLLVKKGSRNLDTHPHNQLVFNY
jgi:hypothetical protein